MLSLKKMLVVASLVMGGVVATGASQAEAGGFGYGCHYPAYTRVHVYRTYTPFYHHYSPTYYAPSYGCFGY